MRVFRLFRGVVLTALTWGLAWAMLGATVSLAVALFSAPTASNLVAPGLLPVTLFYGIVGMWAGGVFAVVMAISERRRAFTDLSMVRVVAWGILGGVSYPLVGLVLNKLMGGDRIGGLGAALGLTGAFGALSAWAMLRAARGAQARPTAQLAAPQTDEWQDASSTAEPIDARTT